MAAALIMLLANATIFASVLLGGLIVAYCCLAVLYLFPSDPAAKKRVFPKGFWRSLFD